MCKDGASVKDSFLLILIIILIPIQVFAKTILDRTWDFKSSADVTFTIKDTLFIHIHFPNNIPDDRLIGYCRFRITVNDSNPGATVNGKSFVYMFQFDSGFNSFDHILTLGLNYNSGLLANRTRNPHNYKVYMDPYPVSKIHQWFPTADSNLTIDTTASILSVSYSQKRLQKSFADGLHKELIASKGYPFDYGLFSVDSSAVIHFHVQHNNENRLRHSQIIRLFTINGKNAGVFSSANENNVKLNNGCFIFQLNQRGFRENAKCTIVKK